ncbi:hypothetical protein VHEMI01390 [[Torrubiella] hemipterigena]|nr:hypothetical protein VHEMI01390 [[Torrubiella] hemipterigena]
MYMVSKERAFELVSNIFTKASLHLRDRIAESIATRRVWLLDLGRRQPKRHLTDTVDEYTSAKRTLALILGAKQPLTLKKLPSLLETTTDTSGLSPSTDIKREELNNTKSETSRDISASLLPPMPKLQFDGTRFTCPFCFISCSATDIKTTESWKKHLIHDLEPYFCVFDSCKMPATYSISYESWLQHMKIKHMKTEWYCWFCQSGPSLKRFSTSIGLEDHLENHHSDRTTESVRATISKYSVLPQQLALASCPFCACSSKDIETHLLNQESYDGFDAWSKHIGDHLIDASFMMLPRDYDRQDQQESNSMEQSLLQNDIKYNDTGGHKTPFHESPEIQPAHLREQFKDDSVGVQLASQMLKTERANPRLLGLSVPRVVTRVDTFVTMATKTASGRRLRRWSPKAILGCLMCRRRRVKCDETRPACKRCAAVGMRCAFSKLELEQSLAKIRIQDQQVYLTEVEGKRLADVHTLLHIMPEVFKLQTKIPAKGSLGITVRNSMALYLPFLPSRAGHHSALDSAIHSLASSVFLYYSMHSIPEGTNINILDRRKALALHSQAVLKLQKALYDPEDSFSAETLCAMVLLGSQEFFINPSSNTYRRGYLSGIQQIIQHRAPQRFTSRMELHLLHYHVEFIIFSAFYSHEHCFLIEYKWQKVLHNIASISTELAVTIVCLLYTGFVFKLVLEADNFINSAIQRREEQRGLLDKLKTLNPFYEWYRIYEAKQMSSVLASTDMHIQNIDEICARGTIFTSFPVEEVFSILRFMVLWLSVALGSPAERDINPDLHALAYMSKYNSTRNEQQGQPAAWASVLHRTIFLPIMDTANEWMSHSRLLPEKHPAHGEGLVIPRAVFGRWIKHMKVCGGSDGFDTWQKLQY